MIRMDIQQVMIVTMTMDMIPMKVHQVMVQVCQDTMIIPMEKHTMMVTEVLVDTMTHMVQVLLQMATMIILMDSITILLLVGNMITLMENIIMLPLQLLGTMIPPTENIMHMDITIP